MTTEIHLFGGWWGVLAVHSGLCILRFLLSRGAFLAARCRFWLFLISRVTLFPSSFGFPGDAFGFPGARFGWGLLRWGIRLGLILDAGGATRLTRTGGSSSSFAGHTETRAEKE